MQIRIRCRQCGAEQPSTSEPRDVATLQCAQCGSRADPQASEDLASALEDALSQLWRVGQTHSVRVELDTDTIPAAFRPDDVEPAS